MPDFTHNFHGVDIYSEFEERFKTAITLQTFLQRCGFPDEEACSLVSDKETPSEQSVFKFKCMIFPVFDRDYRDKNCSDLMVRTSCVNQTSLKWG